MHDPLTQAFEIQFPWPFKRYEYTAKRNPQDPFGRPCRPPLITIWHRDPSGYDSTTCQWCWPKLSEWQASVARELASQDSNPTFVFYCGRAQCGPGDGFVLFLSFARAYWWRSRRRRLPRGFVDLALDKMGPSGVDDGFKTWFSAKTEEQVTEAFIRLAMMVEWIMRPWYRHPRWHIHHWRIQIHPLQLLLRAVFTKCSECGRSVGWNRSVVSKSWDRPRRPFWLFWKGERDLVCDRCHPASAAQAATPGAA